MSGVPYEVYSYATCIIEVEVDTDTGEVQLLKCVSAHDVGTPVGVKMCEGQIEGGTAMGTGFVVSEKIRDRSQDLRYQEPLPQQVHHRHEHGRSRGIPDRCFQRG